MALPAFAAEQSLYASQIGYALRTTNAAFGPVIQAGFWCQSACEVWCNSQGGDPLGCQRVCSRICKGLPVTETANG